MTEEKCQDEVGGTSHMRTEAALERGGPRREIKEGQNDLTGLTERKVVLRGIL